MYTINKLNAAYHKLLKMSVGVSKFESTSFFVYVFYLMFNVVKHLLEKRSTMFPVDLIIPQMILLCLSVHVLVNLNPGSKGSVKNCCLSHDSFPRFSL